MMKAWDLLRSQFKPDGKGRYKTVDAMRVAKQLEEEVDRLKKYEKLVQYIASDYWELSYDKIRWLYTEYKTKSRKLIEEDNE